MKPSPVLTVYQWRVLERDKRGKDRWRILRWRMTEEEAASWAASNGKRIERVEGSAEHRNDLRGDGVGQFVPPMPRLV